MRSLVPFRDINVHASTSHYAFTSPSSPSTQTLVVERPSGDIRLNDGALLGAKRVSSIAGILGIIKLRLDKYIIVITKAQPMGRLKGHMVYKIIATEFLPLRERTLHDPDEDTYLNLLKILLKSGPMYFSYSLDITNSFQRQAASNPSLALWERADDRFFWNKFIQSDLIDFATGATTGSGLRQHGHRESGADPFILPVMFGMMRITTTRIKSTPLTFVLITRRSRHRAGTRYLTRGMDEQGHVANFNETEQIAVLNDESRGLGGIGVEAGMQNGKVGGFEGQDMQVMSYVQTRGSVPVYWAEINTLRYVPDLQIRGVETAVGAAKLHFSEQIRLYGDNYLVNLVNQKGREAKVKQAYEQMVRMLLSSPQEASEANDVTDQKIHVVESTQRGHEYDRLHYVYFDFHNETKGLRWHRAQLLLDQLKEGLVQGQYFRGVDMPGDSQGRLEVRNRQVAVVRTNCMDCLDRTNVVQTMLARWTLTRQLIDIGILRPGESADDDQAFQILFRNVWADNADVVSRSYSGTGALKTDFTRTGERTRAGAMQDLNNSITRYVKNNFSDGPRQDAFDLFLGTFLPDSSSIGSGRAFVDRRPVLIQSIPYVLAASVFMVLISSLPRSSSDTAWWPLRLFAVLWLAIGFWCFRFMYGHGVLYVNWPKLNTPRWANEGYQETMGAIRQDKIIGSFVAGHERGASNARISHLEEGKKRIQ
ncbi:Phosphoinositide phosphatase sac1 [Xanthoria calcicola]